MNKTSQKTVLLLAAIVAASAIANAAESTNVTSNNAALAKPFELFTNDIVAKGDGVKVTRPMLDEALVNLQASAAARGQSIPPQRMQLLEAQVLDRLVGLQLLNKMATEADKTNGAAEASTQLERIRKGAGDEESFKRQLKTVGMTLDDLKKNLKEQAVAEAVLQRVIHFDVSDADVKNFYDENPSQFERPETVRAAHVLISTRNKDGSEMTDEQKKAQHKKAEDILKRAKAGEDFALLAKEYSDDPGSKDRGGEYTFPRGQMMPQFEAAAFSLETNQISDIVTTPYGYHIIKLLEKHPAKTISLEEAAPDIKKYLKNRGMQKQIPGYMSKLEKAAHVEILDKDLKKTLDEQDAARIADEAQNAPKDGKKEADTKP